MCGALLAWRAWADAVDRSWPLCVQREAVWALGNVASGTSAQTRAVVACDAVPHFVVLLSHDDAAVRVLSLAPCGHAFMTHTVSAPAAQLRHMRWPRVLALAVTL